MQAVQLDAPLELYVPAAHRVGASAGSKQNDPAGHDAQYVDAGESEYVPLGHTVGSS